MSLNCSSTVLSSAKFSFDFTPINQLHAPISLRLQNAEDMDWVHDLHQRAFGPGRFTRSAFLVREMHGLDLDLCIIAETSGKKVGSVWMTPISLGEQSGFLLGPLATEPTMRNLGIGRLLVKTVTEMAQKKLPTGFVLLVGDAPYYKPLGFEATVPGAINFPGPVDPNRVLVCCSRLTHAKELVGTIAGPNRIKLT